MGMAKMEDEELVMTITSDAEVWRDCRVVCNGCVISQRINQQVESMDESSDDEQTNDAALQAALISKVGECKSIHGDNALRY